MEAVASGGGLRLNAVHLAPVSASNCRCRARSYRSRIHCVPGLSWTAYCRLRRLMGLGRRPITVGLGCLPERRITSSRPSGMLIRLPCAVSVDLSRRGWQMSATGVSRQVDSERLNNRAPSLPCKTREGSSSVLPECDYRVYGHCPESGAQACRDGDQGQDDGSIKI